MPQFGKCQTRQNVVVGIEVAMRGTGIEISTQRDYQYQLD